MNRELAIECIKTQRQFVDEMTRDAFDLAIELLNMVSVCPKCPYNPIKVAEDGRK